MIYYLFIISFNLALHAILFVGYRKYYIYRCVYVCDYLIANIYIVLIKVNKGFLVSFETYNI